MKERMNAIVYPDGTVSASLVNLPVVVQAENMEEAKKQAKYLAESFIEMLSLTLKQDDPFEVVEYDYNSMIGSLNK